MQCLDLSHACTLHVSSAFANGGGLPAISRCLNQGGADVGTHHLSKHAFGGSGCWQRTSYHFSRSDLQAVRRMTQSTNQRA